MDVKAALITALAEHLMADPTLKELFKLDGEVEGTVRVRYQWAVQDENFPYLVHTADLLTQEDWLTSEASYVLDIWDHGQNASRMLAIRERLLELLNRERLALAGGEATGIRIYYDGESEVPEPEPEIWRLTTSWTIRFFRDAEVSAIQAREEV